MPLIDPLSLLKDGSSPNHFLFMYLQQKAVGVDGVATRIKRIPSVLGYYMGSHSHSTQDLLSK